MMLGLPQTVEQTDLSHPFHSFWAIFHVELLSVGVLQAMPP